MFRQIAHWLGLKEKDEALAKRFAKMRQQYGVDSAEQQHADVLAISRTGLQMRAVVGAEKTTGEQLKKNLLESYARTTGSYEAVEKEPVGTK